MLSTVKLDYNFQGLMSGPYINNLNEFKVQLLKFLLNIENIDILTIIPDSILSMCDIIVIKKSILFQSNFEFKNKLIEELYLFLQDNILILGRFPQHLTRFIDSYIRDLKSKPIPPPLFSDIAKVDNRNRIIPVINVKSIEYDNSKIDKIIPKDDTKTKENKISEKTNCIMLRNLNFKVDCEEIKKIFKIAKVKFPGNDCIHFPNSRKGFKLSYVFITFENVDEAQSAKKLLEGFVWNHCILNVLNAKGNKYKGCSYKN